MSAAHHLTMAARLASLAEQQCSRARDHDPISDAYRRSMNASIRFLDRALWHEEQAKKFTMEEERARSYQHTVIRFHRTVAS